MKSGARLPAHRSRFCAGSSTGGWMNRRHRPQDVGAFVSPATVVMESGAVDSRPVEEYEEVGQNGRRPNRSALDQTAGPQRKRHQVERLQQDHETDRERRIAASPHRLSWTAFSATAPPAPEAARATAARCSDSRGSAEDSSHGDAEPWRY